MSRTHDNWEKLVAAVIRKEELWQLCHQHSSTSSLMSSFSSDLTSSFRSNLSFSNPNDGLSLPFQYLADISIDLSQEEKEPELVFFKDSPIEFGLEELLMASSYVLGEEIDTFKRTFVVCLRKDIKVVVKKFTTQYFAPNQLQKWIETIGSFNDENVAKSWGYGLCKGEMLCFYEYFPQGSTHAMLHRKPWVVLDCETRLSIAIGTAKGLARMHKTFDGKFVHGNIKASNIFLNSHGCCLGDPTPGNFKISGYHPPEVSSGDKASQASDVYNFGVFLIELVSQRSPTQRFRNYVDWARNHYRDEWTFLVYDVEILKKLSEKKQIFEMLKIAMCCVRNIPEERPNVNDVVDMLCRVKLLL
ncbi:hypothetical protein RD792_005443 [Penstemon davidsonii]|uniref:Protein kinase domain-containing protein n=1 Tax=Penstemon davidsonii TaxID=160366 RepID=A0ABR0DK73_9LAMI|nr:hypothetical protein RD792_005443 [Penstemon davidsonii]